MERAGSRSGLSHFLPCLDVLIYGEWDGIEQWSWKVCTEVQKLASAVTGRDGQSKVRKQENAAWREQTIAAQTPQLAPQCPHTAEEGPFHSEARPRSFELSEEKNELVEVKNSKN